MSKKAKKKDDCKPTATRVQNRAILRLATDERPVFGRRPNSLSRSILPALLALLLLLGAPAHAAWMVTGLVNQVTSAALDTAISFHPGEDILLLNNGLSGGPAKTIYSTNGAFSVTLDAGNYLVRLPLITSRNPFTIGVPHGTGTTDITNLIAAPWTYEDFVNTIGGNVGSSATNVFFLASTNITPSVSGGSNVFTVTGQVPLATAALGMTNIVTVSSRGIANGTSATTNNGHRYGPDTPGTTTSGLQEALTAAQTGSNAGPYMVSAKIELTDGNFFFTNVLTYSNSYTAALEIAGAGMLNTTLIYAGATTVSNCISLTGGNHSGGVLQIPLHATLRDMTVTALQQATNVLVYIGQSSYQRIANMNFTGWNVRTNQDTGAGVSFTPDRATYPPGLVGLRINTALDHSTVLENIFFGGLAVGARVKSDHPSGRDLRFSNISYGSYGSTNIWPTNTIYNIGAGIIVEGNAYDSLWVYGHLYALRCGFAAVGCSVAPTLIGWHFESAGFPVVSDTELCPKLIDPISTSGDFASFDQYKLYTPTSSNYTTNYYKLTTEDHTYGYQRGMGRYEGGDYGFFVRRANSTKAYMDGASDFLVADGEGLFDIIPNGMRATNSPSANKVWKAIDGTTGYWGDDNNSGSGSSIFYTNSALGGYTNTYGLRLYSNASIDATNITVGGQVGIDATGISVAAKVSLTSADQTFASDTLPTTIYADGSLDLLAGKVHAEATGMTNTIPFKAPAVVVTNYAYDATGWNGNTSVPTRDDVRDKIESLSAGSFTLTMNPNQFAQAGGTTNIKSGATLTNVNQWGNFVLRSEDAANDITLSNNSLKIKINSTASPYTADTEIGEDIKTRTFYGTSNNITGGISAGSIAVGTSPIKITIDGTTGVGGFAGDLYLTNRAANKILRTDANKGTAEVTVGSGLSFDGTTLTASGGSSTTNFFSSHAPIGSTNQYSSGLLWSTTIPGGSIGTNGSVVVTALVQAIYSGGGNSQLDVKYGSTTVATMSWDSSGWFSGQRTIMNDNSEAATVCFGNTPQSFAVSSSAGITSTFNTTTNFTLGIYLRSDSSIVTNLIRGIDVKINGNN